jgi:uncharacterized membrane protein
MLVAAVGPRARGMLNSMLLLTACVQLLDAVIDGAEGRCAIVPGVVLFGILFLVAAARLSGYPFWRIEAWKQPL